MLPRFLDIEASSLNVESYPIEIAWSNEFGDIECHLINPSTIEVWTDWDFYAEHEIHGISRALCQASGLHPQEICTLMNQSIKAGEIIYADGGRYDQNWLDVLYGAGSECGFANFKIVHSDVVMLPLLKKIEPDNRKCWYLYDKLKAEARHAVKEQHRATVDVQYLIELWRLCYSLSQVGI